MTLETYKELVRIGFISYGQINRHEFFSGWFPEKSKQIKGINDKLLEDLNQDYDFNNIIIIFPNTNWLITKEIISSHVIDIVDIRKGLTKLGITYRKGISMCDKKYAQRSVSMLVIQDGIAYSSPRNSDALTTSFYDGTDIVDATDNDMLNMKNKSIIFSGIAKHLLK